MQRPGTAVLATTVTGTFFWADSVIMKVQLDPDHICKVQDTWVIYRVKFTDPAHPHLLGTSFSAAVVSVCLTCANAIADTEAKHVKPIRIRRKPREFKVSKAMSLKEKNDLMYEEFLREKEEREKRMVCLALVLHVGNSHGHRHWERHIRGRCLSGGCGAASVPPRRDRGEERGALPGERAETHD